jgi:hypothetical protein
LGNFDLVVDGAKCSRILTHQPVNQNCTSNLNPRVYVGIKKPKSTVVPTIQKKYLSERARL